MSELTQAARATDFDAVAAISEAAVRHLRSLEVCYAALAPSRPARRAVTREAHIAMDKIEKTAADAVSRLHMEARGGAISDRMSAQILRSLIGKIEAALGAVTFTHPSDLMARCWLDPQAVEKLTAIVADFQLDGR